MQRWRRLSLVVVLLAASACSRDRPPPDHAALHPEETAALPSTPSAPTTAPPTTAALGEQVTTVEAAQRLLDLFAHLDGDAARMLLQKGAPDAEFDHALQAVYVGQALETVREASNDGKATSFVHYARPQGDPLFRATSVVDARRSDCVVVNGTIDLQPRYIEHVDLIEGIFVLVIANGIIPSTENPTLWRMLVGGHPAAGTDLEAICPSL